ncbi:MAG: bifunctional UDP-sugar hydrolase/5'-nucleotidase [Erysipelotrichaceae bacterium]|nr:bifunctional UDP-sugar hydrolase/5'-nucleotidase [Erysipelotrichaceae bacterium]
MKKTCLCITSDVHGAILSKNYADNSEVFYGLARYSTAIKQLKTKVDEVLLFDNGDAIQGSPLLTVSNQDDTYTHILSTVFNHLDMSFINLGNHDFNYGESTLLRYIRDNSATLLTSNVLFLDNPLGKSQVKTLANGIRLGLIGLVTDYIPHWEKPEYIAHMKFLDPIETLRKEISLIRNQCDIIMVLYHGGIERDFVTGLPTETLTKENVGYQMCGVDGFDILITGHQHRSFVTTIHGKIVAQCAANASEFIKIDLDENINVTLEKTSSFEIDRQIEPLVSLLEKQTQVWLDQPLGEIKDISLLIPHGFFARLHKHPLVSFINQVQKETSGAQLSATALFNNAIGFDLFITMRDLVSTYVYPNTLVVKKMSGKDLKLMIELCANYFEIENDEIVVSKEYTYPKIQHFNYDMIDGIDYTLKISNPKGSRCISCTYNGKEIEDDDSFTIAMNNYRAVGGGDFEMVARSETILDTHRDMVEILAEYIQINSPVIVNHKENIRILK